MHDLHLANKIQKLIIEEAQKNKLRLVKRAIIELGVISEHGSDITKENLEFNLNLLLKGTLAENAELKINKIKGNAWKLISISGE
ncbi:MAG: hydrogenase/urease maturation nickel metallochaperone HypA [Parcubacteria group bacterium]